MEPSAVSSDLAPYSAIQEQINASASRVKDSQHEPHLHHLAEVVRHNLQYQHAWSSLCIHTRSNRNKVLPRPMVSGLPPRRVYIHPDEQVEILKAEHETGDTIKQVPELEWVLPTHWEEKWSIARFSEVFDAIEVVPPSRNEQLDKEEESGVGHQWRGENRQKRLFLSTVHDDSTVVYYIMHDGLAKPRQN
ncbi:Sen15 protein-domain-containing protein [Bisporella sp. PMI_857]|nr:Sen15 protein-domain-containing protein [Bisporella sp. PMI_857]